MRSATRFPSLSPTGVSNATTNAAIVIAIVVAALHFGKSVIIPFALAVLLSFALSPVVVALRKLRIPRAAAVGFVVLIVVGAVAGLGTLMARQVGELAGDLPKYEVTLREKLKVFRVGVTRTSIIDKAASTLQELNKELDQAVTRPPVDAPSALPSVPSKPILVEVSPPHERPLETYQRIISALIMPVTTSGIVLLLVVFMLLQREDIRDRIIRLVGKGDVELATTALADAGARLSRLLLAQAALNCAYGVVIAVGLLIIGVPGAILWGIIAALMRFVPYIGAILSAVFPILLAAAVDPGWTQVLWTIALYAVIEPVVGHVIEPLLQGQTTGLSPLAVVLAAIIWTALWGPIGLLLSTPLTMCLVVLGRHIDGLSVLDVILGDQPALSPPEVFYHRMLTGTSVEAVDQAEEALESGTIADYADQIALPGLAIAEADVQRGVLDAERISDIREGIHELVETLRLAPPQAAAKEKVELEDGETDAQPQTTENAPEPLDLHVLCLGMKSSLDTAAAELLALVLEIGRAHV